MLSSAALFSLSASIKDILGVSDISLRAWSRPFLVLILAINCSNFIQLSILKSGNCIGNEMADNLGIKIRIHYIPGSCLKSFLGIVSTSICMFIPGMSWQSRVIPYLLHFRYPKGQH